MQRIKLFAGLFVVFAFLSGCSTVVQLPVNFSPASIPNKSAVMGVVQTKVPEFSVNFPGADCLLCVGVAIAAHTTVRGHANTISTSELQTIGDDLAKTMTSRGYSVKKIAQTIDLSKLEKNSAPKDGYSKYNFSSYAKDGISMLLVVDITTVGFQRSYQSYFPTGPMMANIKAEVYLVNTADSKFLSYQKYNTLKGAEGPWNVEPKFPQLTNAYYSMIEEFKDSISKSLE